LAKEREKEAKKNPTTSTTATIIPPSDSVNNNNRRNTGNNSPIQSSSPDEPRRQSTTSPIPQVPDLSTIAWCGSISRVEAEEILERREDGTFLTRWSNNTRSYVLSMVRHGIVQHISGLTPGNQGQITVVKENGSLAIFPTLGAYVERMQVMGIVSRPLELTDQIHNIVYHTQGDRV